MKINTKVRYGIRTMIEIGLRWNGEGVFQKEIAGNQEISFKYLDLIIATLKASGLIQNAEGRGSGYRLTRDPKAITVYDIYRAFENDLCIIDCIGMGNECNRDGVCPTKDFWHEFNQQMIAFMEKTTVQDLIEKHHALQQSDEVNVFVI